MKSSRNRPSRQSGQRKSVRGYSFDYSKSRRNKFAGKVGRDAVVVVLDSDVARVFKDSKQVNALLRATIASFEKSRSKKAG